MTRAAVIVLALGAAPASAQQRPSDFGAWFLKTYGPARPRDAELVARAQGVFGRVLAVADHKSGRRPRLLVVDRAEGFEAQALPDGTIVMNPALLAVCFGAPGTPTVTGDARLAFVLGHEIAHLAYDDSWHAEAFAAVTRYGDPALREATRSWAREPLEQRQAKELRADGAGFLFLMLAGYPPRAVTGGRTDFLAEWARKTIPQGDPEYPAFEQRAGMLRTQIAALEQVLPFHHFGVRLLTLGRYDDAIRMLERFHRGFPSRESGANLGAAYFQRALVRLLDCGEPKARRFRLPTLLAPESLAYRLRLRGGGQTCHGNDEDLAAAEKVLREGYASDPRHVPTRVGLATVLLLKRDAALEAYQVATDADDAGKRLMPADPELSNVAAVAHQLSAEVMDVHTLEALGELEELKSRLSSSENQATRAAVTFNLARLQELSDRRAAVRPIWSEFLQLEPVGPWADEARLALYQAGESLPDAPSPGLRRMTRARLAQRLTPTLRRGLRTASRSAFREGDLTGAFLQAPGMTALELGGVLEIVEETVAPSEVAALLRRFGPPRATFSALAARRTLVYDDTAYDVEHDSVVRRVSFESR